MRIADSQLGDRVNVNNFCVIVGARVANGVRIGPFAHLRPDSIVGEGAHIGNFVELKKTSMGPGAKANHLAYLGDATIGANVNIAPAPSSATTMVTTSTAVIEDGAFIGISRSLLRALTIRRGAYVCTCHRSRDVPSGALAVTPASSETRRLGGLRKRATERHTYSHSADSRLIGSKPVVPA